MAIQQVSRITVRKGLAEDLPQPLAGAELGWALDQRKLYIGNGTLADGAPIVGNTEILTEFSDLFEYSSAYTYLGEAAGYTVQTGITSGAPISQSLQNRLDSYAVVTDFGAKGDGVTDDTAAINRALFQLYCVQANTQIRRSLFFPAGEYIVTDTILVPPYANLYGEGADSSIIQFSELPWAANTAYPQAGVLVVRSGSYFRSKIPVPATGIDTSDTIYWDATTLPPYVVRTTDSAQQTGNNISVGTAVPPSHITVTDMAFKTAEVVTGSHDVLLLEKVANSTFRGVTFAGALTENELDVDTNDLAGVRFSSSASLPCAAITFDNCFFNNMTYGVYAEQPNFTKGIVIANSSFDTLYQGVVLTGDNNPASNDNPRSFRFVSNTFDETYAEAVVIDGCFLNGTAYNVFLNVANQFLDGSFAGATSPVMTINADNNVSVGDLFARTDSQAAASDPRILLLDSAASPAQVPASIAFTNGRQIQLGSYTRQSGVQQEIQDGTAVTLFTINTAVGAAEGGPQSFVMDYTMVRDTAFSRAVRTGSLTVVSFDLGDSAAAAPLTWTDEFTENQQTDMSLSVSETGGNVTVTVTSSATGQDGRIYYSTNYLA